MTQTEIAIDSPSDTTESAFRHRLSTRIIAISVTGLCIVLTMISGTLWLSWQLEGAAAAINDTGSLRMRANRIAIELAEAAAGRPQRTGEEMAAFDHTLAELKHGNAMRPLFLPSDKAVQAQMQVVVERWQTKLKPAAERELKATLAASRGNHKSDYLITLPAFVSEADKLVSMIERDNARKTTWLRSSQAVLLVIACIGTLTMIYLLYLWIITPVSRLQKGLQRMGAGEFSARLPLETRDEFGALTLGFNRMADELSALYDDLETRVQSKTQQLAAQNRELGALYDMAAFLNQPNEIEPICQGFLSRVMQQFHAEAGSIRVIDPLEGKLHLLVSEGLSEALEESEHCMKVDACFCGKATQQDVVVIRDFRKLPASETLLCARDGFTSLAVFRIVTQEQVLGSFSLHFRNEHVLSDSDEQLLETLGQHLGVALENRRLSAKARQLAVAEERNLVAQGLHDSIAQGLNFLNLQVQMLDNATERGDLAEVADIVPLLRAGVDESYQDVRELLLNFRSKLGQGELKSAMQDTIERFRRQTHITIDLLMDNPDGAPLPPEQQLQVLFILQEALSNVRKHAQASAVNVRVSNERDFVLIVSDNGKGYDMAAIAQRSEQHVGMNIMQERANRLNAVLTLHSAPGQGTTIELRLPGSERQAA